MSVKHRENSILEIRNREAEAQKASENQLLILEYQTAILQGLADLYEMMLSGGEPK